jgi:ATP-dependent protease Clp ATPase subunit
MEAALTDTMFEAPNWKDVEKVVVTKEALLRKSAPTLITTRERTRRTSAA